MFFSMCHHAEICIFSLQDPNSNWFWLIYVLIVSPHTSFHHPDRTNSNMRRYAFYFCSLLHYYTITFHSSSLFSVLLEFFRMLIYSVKFSTRSLAVILVHQSLSQLQALVKDQNFVWVGSWLLSWWMCSPEQFVAILSSNPPPPSACNFSSHFRDVDNSRKPGKLPGCELNFSGCEALLLSLKCF